MKKIILSAFALLPFFGFAQKTFTVNGSANTLKAGDKIYLFYNSGEKRIVDSSIVSNKSFEFKGIVEGTINANIYKNVSPDAKGTDTRYLDYMSLYVEPGNITIKTVDSLTSAIAVGSPTNDASAKLDSLLKPYSDKMNAIGAEYNKYTQAQKEDKAVMDNLQKRIQEITAQMEPINLQFAKNNPNSFISLITLLRLSANEKYTAEIEKAYKKLSPDLKASQAGEMLLATISTAKNTEIGFTPADFTQNDVNGNAVKLSDFRGKYLLIDFWASWCGPCRKENPNVVTAYHKYKDKNFAVLGISLDGGNTKTTRENWLKAIAADHLTWTNVTDMKGWSNEVAKSWGITAIPANFLIDPSGKIIAKNLRGEDLSKKLEEIFSAKTK